MTLRRGTDGEAAVYAVGHIQCWSSRGMLAVLAGVGAVAQALVDHVLAQGRGARAHAGHPVDDVDDQVEAVHVVA